MGKKIVLSFPGVRGCEIPLLYFSAKHFEDAGYEKVFISPPDSGDTTFEALYENAEKKIRSIPFGEYEDIVFVAKSMGTVVACAIKEKYELPASLVLFTPLKDTIPYINNKNNILLIAAGEKDRYLDPELLKEVCEKENIKYHIEPDVGHRMEITGDLKRNLEILFNVIHELP
ncbi:MAG: hypothetical protein NC121_06700 [Blautia sp.]|nr:hypothetical protein [Blautia sp.]